MGRSLAIVFALATLKNCGRTLLRKQWKPIIISQVRWREGHPALRLGADLGKCRDYPYLRNPGTCSFCNHSNTATSNRRDEVSIGVVFSFFGDSLLSPVSFSAGRETLLGRFVQTGWGKMHHIAKVTGFFAGLDILGSRRIGLLLAGNMMVAY